MRGLFHKVTPIQKSLVAVHRSKTIESNQAPVAVWLRAPREALFKLNITCPDLLRAFVTVAITAFIWGGVNSFVCVTACEGLLHVVSDPCFFLPAVFSCSLPAPLWMHQTPPPRGPGPGV